jgi:hypothetical protein
VFTLKEARKSYLIPLSLGDYTDQALERESDFGGESNRSVVP